jgi:hypothetical protein
MGDFKARRYAVKFNPPRFILEYADDTGKTRTRSVRPRRPSLVAPMSTPTSPPRIQPLTSSPSRAAPPPRPRHPPQIGVRIPEDPDPDVIVADVTRAFPRRLDRSGVRREQVLGLVRRMLDAARGAGSTSAGFVEDVDLNVVSPEKLIEAKAAMDQGFNKNRKVLGDPGFVYDVQREFRPTQPNDWDDSDDDDDDVAGLLP